LPLATWSTKRSGTAAVLVSLQPASWFIATQSTPSWVEYHAAAKEDLVIAVPASMSRIASTLLVQSAPWGGITYRPSVILHRRDVSATCRSGLRHTPGRILVSWPPSCTQRYLFDGLRPCVLLILRGCHRGCAGCRRPRRWSITVVAKLDCAGCDHQSWNDDLVCDGRGKTRETSSERFGCHCRR
jgi:hypothetical protein